ncbi:MAG: alkaline phosphatase family protein [Acidobacteriaceae bacterium]|nr:alkaline phosphatase family protein [Acidobacteriaceae bacterium]
MPAALDNLKHIVVLMMENRSFDHMLGALKAQDSRIDGLTGSESNPDTTGEPIKVQPQAEFQSQLDPDPGHHYPDVDLQLFPDNADRSTVPTMQGFIQAYFQQQKDVNHSHKIMYYFTPDKLPVITTLARKYLVFNRWFSSLPGPTIPNRAFAHFGTSFGKVDMDLLYLGEKYLSVYERMQNAGRKAKIYYYDQQSSTMGVVFLLKSQPQLFGTYDQFLADCKSGNLPDYSFIEPNYSDHDADDGEALASDQHPDHDVQAGEMFMASVYNAIRSSPVWQNAALLIVYDEHGGIYDHVPPPACTPGEFKDQSTGFEFNRLGVRVPAILVSPWVPEGTVVSPLNADGTIDQERVFEHASIPNTVTNFFIGAYDARTQREKNSETFLDLLSLPAPRTDFFEFNIGGTAPAAPAARARVAAAGGAFTAHGFAEPAPAVSPESISVPAPSPLAMNRNRPISDLLHNQIDHLHKAELTLPPDQQTGVDVHSIQTEAQASDYIRQVMAKLHPRVARAGGS